jgi:stearoyl-CoA desaturase (Delta-9 desaturase)
VPLGGLRPRRLLQRTEVEHVVIASIERSDAPPAFESPDDLAIGGACRASAPQLPAAGSKRQQVITAAIVVTPLVGVVAAASGLISPRITLLDVILAVVFYAVSGHGLTAGFHRMFTHRSFKAARWVKISLAVAGSLAMEGSVISWVANHRRHHAYTDKEGDPHSPYEYGKGTRNQIRAAVHAHVGWLFQAQPTQEARWAPDLTKDRDLVTISRLFPLLGIVSLGLPMLIGWAITGTWVGALGGLIWGGLIRVFVLHHATFSVNSVCHLWGRRPFKTRTDDKSTNFAPLALLAMGENWHNLHHSCPTLARHGVDRHQIDSTARLIWVLEHVGVAWDVNWPVAEVLDRRRRHALPGVN